MQEASPAATDVQVRDLPQVRATANLLIAVGILELVYGQWTAPPGQLKLDIMWLAVGLALYFGNAKLIAVIRWMALFAVVPAVVMPVQQLLLAPLELTMVQLRLYPAQVLLFFVPLLITAALVSFVAWRLNSEPVKSVLRAHGRTPAGPVVPAVLGLLVIIGSTAFLHRTLDGPDAAQAAEMAAKRFGTKYKYFTNRLHVVSNKGTTVYATVQMWNDHEALQVPVQWSR
ncbi:hypothetical protein [Massilia yuzhufengensis]|uniref:Uncharacterized protein n=1 Tax=Massilia yuzhufengensis TaxID=1164594 RepID=A0A1I1L908_9BURK|nr:hypothetical protein [Massilia yuzhufengensis]SFC66883.1 hypothetical protein SAMN05216204_108175 [Massilia yuzhufengensis]